MIIANSQDIQGWIDSSIHNQVAEWFESNGQKWLSDCATALNLSYQQVAWALAYRANGQQFVLTALPTSDAELSLAIQLDAMWNG